MHSTSQQLRNETQIQQSYEHIQDSIKAFMDASQFNRDLFKKFGTAISEFANSIESISKYTSNQSDNQLTLLSDRLLLVFKDMALQTKHLGSSIISVSQYLKEQLQPIQAFKDDLKASYNERVKYLNNLKKQFQQANSKLDELQQKIDVYQKTVCPIETKQNQQYQFLLHQEKQAKNEQKLRYQTKKEQIVDLNQFIDESNSKVEDQFQQFYEILNSAAHNTLIQFNRTFQNLAPVEKLSQTEKSMILGNISKGSMSKLLNKSQNQSNSNHSSCIRSKSPSQILQQGSSQNQQNSSHSSQFFGSKQSSQSQYSGTPRNRMNNSSNRKSIPKSKSPYQKNENEYFESKPLTNLSNISTKYQPQTDCTKLKQTYQTQQRNGTHHSQIEEIFSSNEHSNKTATKSQMENQFFRTNQF